MASRLRDSVSQVAPRRGPTTQLLISFEDRTKTISVTDHQDRLQPAERLIETVLSGVPDAVIALDRDGRVVAWNRAAQKFAPALAHEIPLSLALRSPDIIEAVRRVANGGDAEHVEVYERVPIDHWTQAHVVPIVLTDGVGASHGLIMLTLHDVTSTRRVEEMRADFVANVSHELRTPLASLSGFIETLQGPARDDSEAQQRFLAIMKEQATRMARLIDDLLSLSSIELKESIPPEQDVDLVAIVRQVVDSLHPLARERGVKVSVGLPPEPHIVRGDRDELIRVFENLVENALKYGASGKRVDVTFAVDAKRNLSVCVRDYGPGIDPLHLPRLTERFYRVDIAESRAQGGTGLGLALVKHILNRHQGRLAIDSKLGEGATFTVVLPLA
jgi:two-component system phosphate regulon sensor histidine kinase PhoR